MEEEVDKTLHVKGQMNFMADWNVVMFLCSPSVQVSIPWDNIKIRITSRLG